MSCESEYIYTDRTDLTVLDYETLQISDTCLVLTDMSEGKSIIYDIKEDKYYRSYSSQYDDDFLLFMIIVMFIIGFIVGLSMRD